MRFVAIAFAVAAASSSAFAQVSFDEQNIQFGFGQLRLLPEVMLELDGTDQLGSRTNTLYSNAYFKWDPLNVNSYAKAEINDYVNAAHTHRIVADGTTLWSYGFAQNTYSASRYGAYTGAQPAGFRNEMLQELNRATQSSTTFLARTLRETFAGDLSMYTGWFPGATLTVVCAPGTVTVGPTTPQTNHLVDPNNPSRTYDGDDVNYYVVYTYAARLKRSAAFHLTRVDTSKPWTVSEIFYTDIQYLNPSTPRVLDWKISVRTGILPTTTNYTFVPPSNARGISNVKGQGG